MPKKLNDAYIQGKMLEAMISLCDLDGKLKIYVCRSHHA